MTSKGFDLKWLRKSSVKPPAIMKNISSLPKLLAFAFLSAALVASAAAQQMAQGTAKVVRIKGSARYATANNVWQPLKVGDVLQPGTIVQTAEKSRVDIVLGDPEAKPSETVWGEMLSYQPVAEQNFIRLWENTVLSIDKLVAANTGTDMITETQLDLKTGRLFGTVKKVSAASKYEVKIPNGVAGVRGTIYTISSDGIIQVLVGSVVVAYVDGSGNVVTQVVIGGQQFDTRTGQISPIPDFDQKRMVRDAKDARIGPNTPPTTFVQDNTTYYVSPRQGFNGNMGTSTPGGGGGGGGGPEVDKPSN